MVAVAHPDLFAAGPSMNQPVEKVDALVVGRDPGAAEFGGAVAALRPRRRASASSPAGRSRCRGPARPARRRASAGGGEPSSTTEAGPPDRITAFGAKFVEEVLGHLLERVDLAIDVELAQAARDELRHLGAEIDDEKAVMLGHGRRIGRSPGRRKHRWLSPSRRPWTCPRACSPRGRGASSRARCRSTSRCRGRRAR